LTKQVSLLKLRGVVAHRGRLNCDHHIFVEPYEDRCSVFDDSSMYHHDKTAEGVQWLLGQVKGFGRMHTSVFRTVMGRSRTTNRKDNGSCTM
jgi:hypothetical protein